MFVQFWLCPQQWNHGGYDVACLINWKTQENELKFMLRFVQITASHMHSLKLDYFQELVDVLESTFNINILRIEILMLLPDKVSAQAFKVLTVSSPGCLCNWDCGTTGKKWIDGNEQEQVRVMYFDSMKQKIESM